MDCECVVSVVWFVSCECGVDCVRGLGRVKDVLKINSFLFISLFYSSLYLNNFLFSSSILTSYSVRWNVPADRYYYVRVFFQVRTWWLCLLSVRDARYVSQIFYYDMTEQNEVEVEVGIDRVLARIRYSKKDMAKCSKNILIIILQSYP